MEFNQCLGSFWCGSRSALEKIDPDPGSEDFFKNYLIFFTMIFFVLSHTFLLKFRNLETFVNLLLVIHESAYFCGSGSGFRKLKCFVSNGSGFWSRALRI